MNQTTINQALKHKNDLLVSATLVGPAGPAQFVITMNDYSMRYNDSFRSELFHVISFVYYNSKKDKKVTVNCGLRSDLSWNDIDWKAIESDMSTRQSQLQEAVRRGDKTAQKKLMKLLVSSFCGRALAVRSVVKSGGAQTPGVDGVL